MFVSKARIPKKDRSIDVNCGCSDWNLRMILCVENFNLPLLVTQFHT